MQALLVDPTLQRERRGLIALPKVALQVVAAALVVARAAVPAAGIKISKGPVTPGPFAVNRRKRYAQPWRAQSPTYELSGRPSLKDLGTISQFNLQIETP